MWFFNGARPATAWSILQIRNESVRLYSRSGETMIHYVLNFIPVTFLTCPLYPFFLGGVAVVIYWDGRELKSITKKHIPELK